MAYGNARRLRRVLRRDGYQCHWCGHLLRTHAQLRKLMESGADTSRFRQATLDHVRPRSEQGGHQAANLVAACGPCNVERSRTDSRINRDRKPQGEIRVESSIECVHPVLPRLDQQRYIDAIPWREHGQPTRSGLVLISKRGRVLLVPVIFVDGVPYLAQGRRGRSWPSDVRWCPLEQLLSD